MALSVPLSRFTSRVGGGSAFFVRHHHTLMKPWTLLDLGFTFAGLFAGIAIGIWASLCWFYGQDGTLGQRVAAGFVITGIILMQIVRWKAGQKKDDKPDA